MYNCLVIMSLKRFFKCPPAKMLQIDFLKKIKRFSYIIQTIRKTLRNLIFLKRKNYHSRVYFYNIAMLIINYN